MNLENELRMGNYILSPDTGNPVKVELNHLKCILDNQLFNGKSYSPIELTEEWLLNLGFRKSFRGKWQKDELAYDIYGGNGLYMHGVTLEIKYVHQLQNLYFSLTGKELTIK